MHTQKREGHPEVEPSISAAAENMQVVSVNKHEDERLKKHPEGKSTDEANDSGKPICSRCDAKSPRTIDPDNGRVTPRSDRPALPNVLDGASSVYAPSSRRPLGRKALSHQIPHPAFESQRLHVPLATQDGRA